MIELSLDSSIYTLDAIKKCIYWYTDKFAVEIKQLDNQFIISLDPKNEEKNLDESEVIKKLKNDLIDFEVRNVVTKETKNIRDLLIAKAFATTDEYESKPPGEITDPVGFKP